VTGSRRRVVEQLAELLRESGRGRAIVDGIAKG
jgi:hypothetical protein